MGSDVLFVLFPAFAIFGRRHIYCCASAIASKLALLSAFAIFVLPDIYTVHASAIASKLALLSAFAIFVLPDIYTVHASAKQINLFFSRLLRIFEIHV